MSIFESPISRTRLSRVSGVLAAAMVWAGLSMPVSAHVIDVVLAPSSLLTKGNEAVTLGNSESARDYYRTALRSNLNDRQRSLAHNGMCVSFIMEERWSEAMVECDRAIRLRPNNWRFYNNRGNIFLEQGDFAKARAEYERGLDIAPEAEIIVRNMLIVELRENAKGGNADVRLTPAQRYL
ncbi:tetratricopeptide repeat protein [Gimibacter soli]|uniref:Tetratricopeptide repeat protein n=1 Tax=Gimibacter soli TaxID=3024400 RepID=A0AAF0BMN8_9PROT|nr:tetratricopeptide repeat protein [Gimibacter soli]WCL54766.1 tetratricopeptide repeat protein [Gimibacter soli]